MKRAKLGDVYYVKLPNGYKIYQWAYDIPRKGTYIRVFDGLYNTIPENIAEIVAGPHNYIVDFDTKRSYYLGLSVCLGNYPIPDEYPMPTLAIDFGKLTNMKWFIEIHDMYTCRSIFEVEGDVDDISEFELPLKYKNVTTLWPHASPAIVFYWFDANFNLQHLKRYKPAPINGDYELPYKPYLDMIEEAFENEKRMKELRKAQKQNSK